MTTGTAAGDLAVIECCRDPRQGAVTGIAGGGCLNMGAVLAGGSAAIVASGTTARGHRAVVEQRRDPGPGVVAVIAGIAAG